VENLLLTSSCTLMVCMCGGILIGCGTTNPLPVELINARQAYAHASMHPGAPLVPAERQKARDALVRAEQAFRDDPSSRRTLDRMRTTKENVK
jgi:hypothetical protein